MKKHHLHIALFVLIFLFFSCKKEKKDTTSPTISISTPASGQGFVMFDTVNVSARVSDETHLTSIVVALVDINNIVLQYSYSVPIQSNDFTFNIKYILNEFHLSSGFYYISVTANDGTNATQRTVKIYITESPTVKTGYFIVGATQPKIITKYDASFVQQTTISLGTGFNGMAFGPYYKQLYINGNINQSFTGYDATMNGTTWSVIYNGGGQPTFECVTTDGQKAFIGYYSGYVGSVNYTGGTSTGYPNGNSNYYPYYFGFSGSYAIGAYKDKFGGSDRLYSFYKNSGVGTNNVFVPFTVIGIFEYTNTQAYIFGNVSGLAAYYLYDATLNSLSGPAVIPNGKLLSVAQVDPNYLLLALDDGKIYGYNCTGLGGSYLPLANIKAQKLIYNPKMHELSASSKNSLYSYSLSTNYVLTLSGFQVLADSIIGFEVITNK